MRRFLTGLCNVWRWTPVIWDDQDWDWQFLAKIMEYKLRRMAARFEQGKHHVGTIKEAKRMKVCAELLKRLQEDNYFENAGYSRLGWNYKSDAEKTRIVNHMMKMQKNDQAYLGKILGKFLCHWWD